MVMKKSAFFMVCVLVSLAFSLPTHAQRLIPKQTGIELVSTVPLIKGEKLFTKDNFGVGVSITRYLKRENYAFVLAEYEQQALPYRTYCVPMREALLHLGYMQPILSDRGKNIFGYLGLSALCGYEELNDGKPLLPDGATLLDRSRFVYGGSLHGSVELFLTDNILFVLKAQGRLLFGSDVRRFRPALSAGLKFNL
jgi:hypothetical protein